MLVRNVFFRAVCLVELLTKRVRYGKVAVNSGKTSNDTHWWTERKVQKHVLSEEMCENCQAAGQKPVNSRFL